jgi:hypothetical protein
MQVAGNGPARSNILARNPGELAAVWSTMNNDPVKFAGNPLANILSASMPPADAPITIISLCMDG